MKILSLCLSQGFQGDQVLLLGVIQIVVEIIQDNPTLLSSMNLVPIFQLPMFLWDKQATLGNCFLTRLFSSRRTSMVSKAIWPFLLSPFILEGLDKKLVGSKMIRGEEYDMVVKVLEAISGISAEQI